MECNRTWRYAYDAVGVDSATAITRCPFSREKGFHFLLFYQEPPWTKTHLLIYTINQNVTNPTRKRSHLEEVWRWWWVEQTCPSPSFGFVPTPHLSKLLCLSLTPRSLLTFHLYFSLFSCTQSSLSLLFVLQSPEWVESCSSAQLGWIVSDSWLQGNGRAIGKKEMEFKDDNDEWLLWQKDG